jgi:hypothetical protein
MVGAWGGGSAGGEGSEVPLRLLPLLGCEHLHSS